MLTIAESGERKSTVDSYFRQPVEQYQRAQTELLKSSVAAYKAKADAWEAERSALLSEIKELVKKGESIDDTKAKLETHENSKPEPVRVPRMILSDVTSEAVNYHLAEVWPSTGLVSSEAGAIFGGHSMGADAIMRNLAGLNLLWDGAPINVARRSGNLIADCARLTVGLQVQPATISDFVRKNGVLARGIGFFARFLMAWPESTQGTRFYREEPDAWPHLERFNRRIAEILDAPLSFEHKTLAPAVLCLSGDAQKVWRNFHDDVERELSPLGELSMIRDVASKIADNAARLAGLFQMFEAGMVDVTAQAMESACIVAAWHLTEAKRFFIDLAEPIEIADARRMDEWMIAYCGLRNIRSISKNVIRQFGPLRDGNKLAAALGVLESLGRVRCNQVGRSTTVYINPQLITGGVTC